MKDDTKHLVDLKKQIEKLNASITTLGLSSYYVCKSSTELTNEDIKNKETLKEIIDTLDKHQSDLQIIEENLYIMTSTFKELKRLRMYLTTKLLKPYREIDGKVKRDDRIN